MQTGEFLTINEVAAWLRVPVESVRRWRADGTGPRAVKVGRHLRYRPADVEKWLEQRSSERSDRNGLR